MGGLFMGVKALNLGLSKTSLIAEPKGSELLYHLRLVPEGKHTNLVNLQFEEVNVTDDCKVYYNNQLIAITSTQELERLIRLSSFKTMELVEVRAEDKIYYAAIHEDLLKRKYVGVLTDEKARACAFVLNIEDTFWANTGSRLIELEYVAESTLTSLTAQEGVKFLNNNPQLLDSKYDEIILF